MLGLTISHAPSLCELSTDIVVTQVRAMISHVQTLESVRVFSVMYWVDVTINVE